MDSIKFALNDSPAFLCEGGAQLSDEGAFPTSCILDGQIGMKFSR